MRGKINVILTQQLIYFLFLTNINWRIAISSFFWSSDRPIVIYLFTMRVQLYFCHYLVVCLWVVPLFHQTLSFPLLFLLFLTSICLLFLWKKSRMKIHDQVFRVEVWVQVTNWEESLVTFLFQDLVHLWREHLKLTYAYDQLDPNGDSSDNEQHQVEFGRVIVSKWSIAPAKVRQVF